MTVDSLQEPERLPLRKVIETRLQEPTIKGLFDRYESEGGFAALTAIIDRIPEADQGPILLALESHVTKEKPLYIFDIAQHYGVPVEKAAQAAAVTDILWALSLVYDDQYDGDKQRAGNDASWVVYGKKRTADSARAGLAAVTGYVETIFSDDAARDTLDMVMTGVASLDELRTFTFETPVEAYVQNYDDRAAFHVALPLRLLHPFMNASPIDIQALSESLYDINRAGQVMNDMRDMDERSRWQRELYSDLRSGTPTIPLRELWQRADANDRTIIDAMFGNPDLTGMQIDAVIAIAQTVQLTSVMYHTIDSMYLEAYTKFHTAAPSIRPDNAFDVWTQYKLDHLASLFSGKDGR